MDSTAQRRLHFTLLFLAVACLLAGCGGGGGEPDSTVSLVRGAALEAWSPDGRWLAISGDEGSNSEKSPVSGDNGVKLVSPDGSVRRAIPVPRTDPVGEFAWASDGELHYLTRPPSGEHGTFATSVRTNGHGLTQVPLDAPVNGAAWAPRGWPLVFIPDSSSFALVGGHDGPPYSLKGERTVRVGPTPKLWILDGPDAKPRAFLPFDNPGPPSFSPDGTRILFSLDRDLWVVDRDGSNAHRLLGGFVQEGASWSPSGKQVALAATAVQGDGRQHLYVLSAQGGQLHQVVQDEILSGPAWTPDGQWLTYSTYAGEIKRVHPDGTGNEVIARFSNHEIRDLLWSPDGRHLAYTSRPFHHET